MKKGGVNIITNDLVKILLIFAEYKEKKPKCVWTVICTTHFLTLNIQQLLKPIKATHSGMDMVCTMK